MNNIKVLLVDDSSVVRGFMRKILETDPAIEIVGSVGNGESALQILNKVAADVILLDLEMPVMDGLSAIPHILERAPDAKILVCSGISEGGADATLKALERGAHDYLTKPSSNSEINSSDVFKNKLLSLIKELVKKQVPSAPSPTKPPTPVTSSKEKKKPHIIAVGSSTGGPKALLEVLKHFSGLSVPVVVTQHMPPTFTGVLARQITETCGVPCVEAEEGMPINSGKIVVARGGYHMSVTLKDSQPVVKLDEGPLENYCRPSVEPMMRSLIDIYNGHILAVMLTGMGNDGHQGFKDVFDRGGHVLLQDEASSVVWGMPGAVAKQGSYDKILPLSQLGPEACDILDRFKR